MRVSAGARRGPGVRALLELDSQAVTGLPRWVPGREHRSTVTTFSRLSSRLSSPQLLTTWKAIHGEPSFLVCVFLIFLLLNRSRNMS